MKYPRFPNRSEEIMAVALRPSHARVPIPKEELARLCAHRGVRRLSLFGSGLREDFRPDSDLDLLVEFQPGATPGFLGLSSLEREIAVLFGNQRIDLQTPASLSRHFLSEVLAAAKPLFEQEG